MARSYPANFHSSEAASLLFPFAEMAVRKFRSFKYFIPPDPPAVTWPCPGRFHTVVLSSPGSNFPLQNSSLRVWIFVTSCLIPREIYTHQLFGLKGNADFEQKQ